MLRVILAAAAATSVVVAVPQGINFQAVNEAPTPTAQGPAIDAVKELPTYKPAAAAKEAAADAAADPVTVDKRSLVTRNACDRQPQGAGPVTSPDTAQDFLANEQYSQIANDAAIPQGYKLVFSDLDGATHQNGYLGFYTLNSYDTVRCQQLCDSVQTCTAFNTYIERDPSLVPGADCPNPPSTVNYKCSLYGLPVSDKTATNTGQWRADFQVVTTGSNGYVKNAPPPSYPGFTGPESLGGAIDVPVNEGNGSYLGVKIYPGPYDPGQCAAACHATDQCRFFNSYILSENNSPIGTYCSFYDRAWDRGYATNFGQFDQAANYYSVSSSYRYTSSTD